MRNKKLIKKIGILFTLILSFVLSVFNPATINAKETADVISTNVEVTSTTRLEDTVTFILKDKLDVVSITYEYTEYYDEILLGRLNHNSTDFTKINDYTYSFDVDSEIVGVKLWLVEYKDYVYHPGTTIDDQTIGNNYVGNVSADYREKYVFINGDLFTTETLDHSLDQFMISSQKSYIISNRLYFNFEGLDVDLVTELDVRYKYYKHIVEPYWIFWSKSYNTDTEERTYHASIDNNQEKDILKSMLLTLKNGTPTSNEYVEIGKSDKEEYQWFVELPSTKYNVMTSNSSVREVIDSVQIFQISYLDEGVYYEDVDVVMDPTDVILYPEKDPEVQWWIKLILVLLVLLAIGILVVILRPIFWIVKYIFIGLWFVIKYTIGLPFVIVYNKEQKQKEQKEFNRKMKQYEQDRKNSINYKYKHYKK